MNMNEIRTNLENILGIYCIFSNDINTITNIHNTTVKSYTMRCMLENNNIQSKLSNNKVIIEDVIVRLSSLAILSKNDNHIKRIQVSVLIIN